MKNTRRTRSLKQGIQQLNTWGRVSLPPPQPMGQITLPPPTVSTAMLTSAFCQVIAYWFLQTTGFWRQMTGFHHYGTMPRPSTGPDKKSALKKMMIG